MKAAFLIGVLIVSAFVLFRTIRSGLDQQKMANDTNESSEVERATMGILSHPKATRSIKEATRLMIQEYENVSAMELRLASVMEESMQKPSTTENLAYNNVRNKIRSLERQIIQCLLFLQTDKVQKAEVLCTDVLLRHQAVQKARRSIPIPKS